MAEWPRQTVQTLRDSSLLLVEDGNHGEYRPRREEFSSVGTAFIRATDMAHGQILFDTASKISESALRRIRKGIGQPWDVLLSHKGTVGKVARTGGSCPPFVCSPQTTFYRSLRHEVIDPRFLFYDLQSSSFQRQLLSRKGETDMADYVSLTEQRRLVIDVPPIVEQRAIAEVLGALDAKIEANNKTLQTIMGLTRTTWRRHAAGATRVSLSHVVRVGLSGVWGEESSTEKASAEVFCLRGRDIEDLTARAQPAPPRRWLSQKQLESRVGADPEIWTAGSGSLGPTLLVTQQLRSGFSLPLVCSNFVKRLTPCAGMERFLPSAWFAVLDAWEAGEFPAFTTGTAMPNLDASALLGSVMVPALEEAAALDLSNWCDLALDPALLNENERLAALRDALLPPLLSGDLRVGDAEALVGDAV
jgi:type I restriction enzyme S subunit